MRPAGHHLSSADIVWVYFDSYDKLFFIEMSDLQERERQEAIATIQSCLLSPDCTNFDVPEFFMGGARCDDYIVSLIS